MHCHFSSMGKSDEQSMQQWIAYVHDIAHHLEGANFKVNDINLIIALTQGLPKEYEPLIASLDATPVDQINVESVITHIPNEEQCQTSDQEVTSMPLVQIATGQHPWTPRNSSITGC